MAAIDKIYIDSFKKYKLFKDWCRLQPKIKDKYGKETSLINYVFNYTEWKDGAVLPICNNPYYIDAYLIRNCPFDFIQKELMLNYGKWDQDRIDEAYEDVMKRGGEKSESGIFHWLSKDDFSVVDGKICLNQGETDYDRIFFMFITSLVYNTSNLSFLSDLSRFNHSNDNLYYPTSENAPESLKIVFRFINNIIIFF